MRILSISIIAVSLLSCNSGDQAKSTKPAGSSANNPPDKTVQTSNACADLVFFQQGVEIETATFDPAGKRTATQVTRVLKVENIDGFTVATVEAFNDNVSTASKDKILHYSYKCDGENIYFDMSTQFGETGKGSNGGFETSMVEYPINVTEGEILPDAQGTMTSSSAGKKMTITYVIKDRKVEAKKDVVTTAAGTYSCYRLTNSISSEVDMPGIDEKTKEVMRKMQGSMKATSTTWFDPDFGIVKMEYRMNGKIQSRNEVVRVKKP